jgi:CRISPR/Cas system-associated endoribonuclease Cas2
MLTWVIYDISKDKTRTKVAKRCLNFGLYRVQKSCFLGDLPPNRVQEILDFSQELLDRDQPHLLSTMRMSPCPLPTSTRPNGKIIWPSAPPPQLALPQAVVAGKSCTRPDGPGSRGAFGRVLPPPLVRSRVPVCYGGTKGSRRRCFSAINFRSARNFG